MTRKSNEKQSKAQQNRERRFYEAEINMALDTLQEEYDKVVAINEPIMRNRRTVEVYTHGQRLESDAKNRPDVWSADQTVRLHGITRDIFHDLLPVRRVDDLPFKLLDPDTREGVTRKMPPENIDALLSTIESEYQRAMAEPDEEERHKFGVMIAAQVGRLNTDLVVNEATWTEDQKERLSAIANATLRNLIPDEQPATDTRQYVIVVETDGPFSNVDEVAGIVETAMTTIAKLAASRYNVTVSPLSAHMEA